MLRGNARRILRWGALPAVSPWKTGQAAGRRRHEAGSYLLRSRPLPELREFLRVGEIPARFG